MPQGPVRHYRHHLYALLGYLALTLVMTYPLVRELGLPYAEITTNPDNVASQRVIEANGGVLVEHFVQPASSGGAMRSTKRPRWLSTQ